MQDENAVNPKLGYTPEEWATLLSHKLTTVRTADEAKAAYAEVIGAAVRAERAACAETAEREFAGSGWHPAARNAAIAIAGAIRSR